MVEQRRMTSRDRLFVWLRDQAPPDFEWTVRFPDGSQRAVRRDEVTFEEDGSITLPKREP